jgi:starch-binding outer membrane protein SusE/F
MKKLLQICILFGVLTAAWSCKKEEKRVVFMGGTAPVVTATKTDSIPLSFVTKDQEAFQLSWTNPNYQFNTGISSLDVNYTIEIDTAGAKFTNPNRKVISLGTDLSKTFTQTELDDYLLNTMQVKADVSHDIEIRVTAALVGGAEPVVSNVLSFKVIPYSIPPKIAPPTSGTLFIVGSATPGGGSHGWDNPISQQVSAQQFTMVSPTLFTITLPLIGGGEYKFISVNGSWDNQWSIKTADDPTELNGGDFVFNGANILAPAVSGNYKVDVDFQRGKFVVTKL